jgi:predicted NAD/FAD-binding protein
MSFGYTSADGTVQYALNWDPASVFAQRTNMAGASAAVGGLAPMMGDVLRLFRRASRDLEAGTIGEASLGDYVRSLGLSERLLHDYLVPMGAAIWSSAPAALPDAPAAFVLGFFRHHGLLSVEAGPRWLYLAGGSRTYVEAIARALGGALRTGTGVAAVTRGEDGVRLALADGTAATFDHVVVATHADQALALLADASPAEAARLGAWRYQGNDAVLHTDASVMPANPAVWASWNYPGTEDPAAAPALTYYLNRLQGHQDTAEPYFLTLNPRQAIDPARVLRRFRFTHPGYTPAAVASRAALAAANGERRTWFCGSYFGNGFHEDAIRAGAEVAAAFGCPL